ncbi:MAG TPA: PilZ domain-containing protein [Acidimicrobiales bacterium]|nr:PilZ domain-containing protein [Acidimicrobiales bacterium]
MSDAARTSAVVPDIGYWAFPDSSDPYLLARVRWPDVAEAISPGCPDWRHDTGLFDLPYDRHSRSLTEDEAALWAGRWGAGLPEDDGAEPALVLIRRMPANWSNLSPADRRAWTLDGVARPLEGVSPDAYGWARMSWWRRLVAWAKPAAPPTAPVKASDDTEPIAAEERRQAARVRVQGTVELRLGPRPLAAELVDVSEAGLHCVVRASQAKPGVGRRLAAPVRLATRHQAQGLDLDVACTVSWRRAVAGTTHLGIELERLDDDQRRRVYEFLASAANEDRS